MSILFFINDLRKHPLTQGISANNKYNLEYNNKILLFHTKFLFTYIVTDTTVTL
jgi:hypothetical protein